MARFGLRRGDSDTESSEGESSESVRQPSPIPANGRPRQGGYGVHQSSSSSSSDEESVQDESSATEEPVGEEEENGADEEDDSAEREEGNEPESTPWAKQLNLEPHRVQVMQSSFFGARDLVKVQGKNNFVFLRRRLPSDLEPEAKPTRTRTSFEQPQPQPPPRKYVRVALSDSVCANNEDIHLDSGLSMGRSFRVGWGPNNKLVHVGGLSTVASSPSKGANSSIVTLTTLKCTMPGEPNILRRLLSNTEFSSSSEEPDYCPFAKPKQGVTFSTLSSLYTAQDRSHAASVFRLGHALYDPINLHLKEDVPDDIRNRIVALRRTDALSSWIARTVAASVEQDIKASGTADSAQSAFLYLTGNQVERAVETLMEGGNVRLATLISQIPGDLDFRNDVYGQLEIWKTEKVDTFMSEPIRKLYALAMGETDMLDGSSRNLEIDICSGFDWLRALGLQIWYRATLDTSLHDTIEYYEKLVKGANGRVGQPKPWYSSAPFSMSGVKDGLFNLIKLSLSDSFTEMMSLEDALNPLSFSPNPRDYRMPWFLYILLSRCLHIRDFSDRESSEEIVEGTDAGENEGYSRVANVLTTSFAAQLQQEDIQHAVFVLLFLEDHAYRKRAIKEMLCQSAAVLTDTDAHILEGSLRIPVEWIHEAKANYRLNSGDIYLAYDLFKQAKVHQTAHELAVTYLAPEAILRDELELLIRIFSTLDVCLVDDFGLGGQLFIDYAKIVSRVPELRQNQAAEDVVPDTAQTQELEALSIKIPRLIAVLPDVLRDKRPDTEDLCKAALSHMLARLLGCVDPSVPMKVEIPPELADEGARIKHIHASAYGSFMRTIEELA